MQLYGIKAGDTVILAGPETGKPIVVYEEIVPPDGYEAYGVWEEDQSSLKYIWRLRPIEGTAEEAMLKLSKLQAQSLPDEYALEVTALFDEWYPGRDCIKDTRLRRKGELYRVIESHVAQTGWEPENAPSLFAKVLPGQEGNEPEEGYAEWVQPDSTNGYSKGDRTQHNGHAWESDVDDNVWEPGAVGAPWTDLGEYPEEA